MGILSNLAGKAITRGTRSGLKGSGRTAPLRTLDEMPTSEATLKRREEGRTLFGTSRQRMEEPPLATDEIKQPVDTPTITTTPPPVDEAKTARMIMLQGADEPIEAAPPITPIETPPIRAEGERIMESAGAAKLYPTYDKYLSDIKELGFSLKDLKSTNLPTNEKQFLIDRERAIQEYVEAPAQGTVRRILSEGGEPYSSNAFGPQAKGVWYKNLKGVDTFEELDTPPVRAEMDELVPPAVPDTPPIRRQVEDLGLSKKEADELLIPDPIDINTVPEAWKAQYKSARDKGFTVPLYHFTRAGKEIQFDPRGEGTGFLDPLLLKQAGNDTRDIGTHLGTLSAMGKMNKRLGKKKRKIMGVTLGQKQGEEQLGQAMLPVVTKLDNVAIVPDMGRFKIPSEWLEELSNLSIERNPKKTIRHILRKDNLEKDFNKNKDIIKNTLDPSIETVDDLKKYVKENGDFIFWPKDSNFVYLKNEKKLGKLDKFIEKVSKQEASEFNPLKGMSPILWKQLMEIAHALHMKNIKLTTKEIDPDADMFIPENIHPALIDDWYNALRKILEDNGYDAFAYPNFVEDYGAFSYMFLDPKKIKSIFAKDFDPESFSFGKKSGGVVDMRNGGRVGR